MAGKEGKKITQRRGEHRDSQRREIRNTQVAVENRK